MILLLESGAAVIGLDSGNTSLLGVVAVSLNVTGRVEELLFVSFSTCVGGMADCW